MLYASVKLSSISYQELEQEEIEELEMTERGVSLPRFREYSAEILLRTYCLLEKYYDLEGKEMVFQMILRTLQEGATDAYSAEVSFFGAKSILDALPDEAMDEKSLQFIK